ncbi:MAG: hypothetical protein M3371_00805, partial [Acidobacteriota bacterium]|nr:hypothetical protein [Acidobacteriota bacterium]
VEGRWSISAGVSATINNAAGSSSIRINVGVNVANITFTPAPPIPASSPLNTYPQVTTPLGTFNVSIPVGSAGLIIPPNGVQFQIIVRQTIPQPKTLVFTAVLGGAVSVAPPSSSVRLTFALPTHQTTTTTYSLPPTFDLVYTGGGGSTTTLNATLRAREPNRLLVRSTGYGPQGAVKRMEMLVTKFALGFNPPAPIVIRGADDPASLANIAVGSANAKRYSGADNAGVDELRPAMAISLQDWNRAYGALTKPNTVNDPEVSILDLDQIPSAASWPAGNPPAPGTLLEGRIVQPPDSAVTPDFLVTANAARAYLNELEAAAVGEGRRFTSCSGVNTGSPGNPQFTFIAGDCRLEGGQGLLVVTGNLEFEGNDDFQGIILALGAGNVQRSGGGNGNILGAWVVARFNINGPGDFLAPTFSTDGGGNGDFFYDSRYVLEANELLSRRVAGVAER